MYGEGSEGGLHLDDSCSASPFRVDFCRAIDDNIYYWAGSSVGERLLDTQEVVGSIPIPPTSKNKPSGELIKLPEGFLLTNTTSL